VTVIGVCLVRLGFRNKTGFHECPQCKSRSVWKADPYGTLEETLYLLLKLSPYRCARCDRRFMDSKIPPADAPVPSMRLWLSRAGSTASRLLRRTPLDEALKAYSLFGKTVPPAAARIAPSRDARSTGRSQASVGEPGNLGENSGVRA
jgi:DNA-directed RNA polymerase subunit RPC12/RpoP